ncbi:hypothetical protein Cri9333_1436 [Crinalium epipsammum PCC 9333]|uniref:Uncharacterized protein n=1 Tax=Crinalium epipsammum PCC 9333 TaxID=1173022 RepID=K9VYU1_9CYAN|nr:hypothetical protein [Crinalium epipsammum]AFZ12330.1 hypothetical protein Cri9333_1436 [Crinalium epipsammum PCC 9333]
MLTTAQEIYTKILLTLPPIERLRLATLILNELVEHNQTVVDYSDTWTEEDQIDITNFSLQYGATLLPESEELGK